MNDSTYSDRLGKATQVVSSICSGLANGTQALATLVKVSELPEDCDVGVYKDKGGTISAIAYVDNGARTIVMRLL